MSLDGGGPGQPPEQARSMEHSERQASPSIDSRAAAGVASEELEETPLRSGGRERSLDRVDQLAKAVSELTKLVQGQPDPRARAAASARAEPPTSSEDDQWGQRSWWWSSSPWGSFSWNHHHDGWQGKREDEDTSKKRLDLSSDPPEFSLVSPATTSCGADQSFDGARCPT